MVLKCSSEADGARVDYILTLIANLIIPIDSKLIEDPDAVEKEVWAFFVVLVHIALAMLVLSAGFFIKRSQFLKTVKWTVVGAALSVSFAMAIDILSLVIFDALLTNMDALLRVILASLIGVLASWSWLAAAAVWRRSARLIGLAKVLVKGGIASVVVLWGSVLLVIFIAVQLGGHDGGGADVFFPNTTSVEVFFGTDRRREFLSTDDQAAYRGWGISNARGKALVLGHAIVTVPISHKRGSIELPSEYIIAGVTLYREKEDPKKHFTLPALRLLTRDSLIREANERIRKAQRYKKSALIFIHGFNTDFEKALFRTAQIAYDLGFDGASFLYSWPTRGGVEQYEGDRNTSEQSQPYLREFLDIVLAATDADQVHVIAHSMGNVPLLRVLREAGLAKSAVYSRKLRQIVLSSSGH